MNNINKLLAMTTATAMLASAMVMPVSANDDTKEKCFGVAKAGKNDCASGNVSCAGSSKVNSDGKAVIVVPKGLCERLVGGSLESK